MNKSLVVKLCGHYGDPDQITSTMESRRVFLLGSFDQGSPPVLTNSLKCSAGRFAFAREIDLAPRFKRLCGVLQIGMNTNLIFHEYKQIYSVYIYNMCQFDIFYLYI